jgi:diguanylate cyclase (GGDEF)-like protein
MAEPLDHQDTTHALVERKLRLLEVWSWWLWTAAILLLLLVGAWSELRQRVLLTSVALFGVFAFYQQLLAGRLRRQLADRQIAALQSRTEFLEELSMIDPLTGLFNRRFAGERLLQEVARAERQGFPLTLVMIDLDNFKTINDELGHPAGDATLQAFATTLRKAVRGSDLPVRWGGDEFLVILPECTIEQAALPLRRLQGCAVQAGTAQVVVEFSVGWAQRRAGETGEQMVERADQLLYEIKRARKEKVH